MFGRRGEHWGRRAIEVPPELQGADREYFLAYGVYPPTVGQDATPAELQQRIDSMSIIVDASHDMDESQQLVREIGYLADKLVELRQVYGDTSGR